MLAKPPSLASWMGSNWLVFAITRLSYFQMSCKSTVYMNKSSWLSYGLSYSVTAFIRGRIAYRRAGAWSPPSIGDMPWFRTINNHDHSRKSKWSKAIKTVISFTPNIPEKPSAWKLVEIMEAGKHAVMSSSLAYDVDQSFNFIDTMYNYWAICKWTTFWSSQNNLNLFCEFP